MSKLLEMKGISKSFYGVEVLHSVDLSLDRGDILALCGENGAGKSTLMKILAGIHEQNAGDVILKDEVVPPSAGPLEMEKRGVSMIHQELNLLNQLTVAQNIFLCREPRNKLGLIDYPKMNEESEKLMKRLGENIDPKQKLKTLKIAQKQMVEIAKAISFNVEILVMDEPTAVLTSKETTILFDLIRKLSSEGIAVIYISHRLKEVSQVCKTVQVLRDGYDIATREVAEVTEKDIASLMVGREVTESTAGEFSGDPDDVVLEVRGVTDEKLKNVGFSVRRGEILGFSGLVGAGRTELMEVIFGMRTPETGEVLLEGKPVTIKSAIDAIKSDVGFVTEDRKETGLVLCRDLTENLNYVYWRKHKGFFKNKKVSAENTDKMIKRLNIRCQGPDQQVKTLSGGNQQKVALAKWLASGAKILILDEPTRGVDVGARQEIYKIINELVDTGITIVIVSSDLPEVLSICERIIVMHEGRVTGELTSTEATEAKVMHYATDV
ncbi:MAG: sugar ABC transporter ATP-binding protein [Spirochaetales bacterium]|nr:sugar ABC transporter ATP-binding protein [Spirochaetales bacterium]MCF7939006.1 sugar ABC transporter ATP-binding protein [Spirochaetales bacterium]